MILSIKKTTILTIAAVCAVCLACAGIYVNSLSVETLSVNDMTIIVDAGHGGMDGGATGVSGVLEKDVNLQIAQKLEAVIQENGGKCVMIRTDDSDLSDPNAKTIREQKRTDLQNRRAKGPLGDGDIFVSIHQNKFEQQQYSGSQVFYADDENSKKLAGILQKNLIAGLGQDGKRQCKLAYTTMFLLQKANIPSVIVECGFLSNPEEEKNLTDSAYQEKVARIIYQSLVEFVG